MRQRACASQTSRSMMVALAIPPPSHIICSAKRPSRCSGALTMVVMMRAPLAPSGCPMAMAPSLTGRPWWRGPSRDSSRRTRRAHGATVPTWRRSARRRCLGARAHRSSGRRTPGRRVAGGQHARSHRNPRHRLHACGDHDVIRAGEDALCGKPMACWLLPHWRSTVVPGTLSGKPAPSSALRAILTD